eukprot:scaffold1947_cov207-Prasinococcus_capsulatus_cf.AAC.2
MAFALFRYLQTGPVAATALLTAGALAPLSSSVEAQVALAALLALCVGIVRILLGIAGAGALAGRIPVSVLQGFSFAASILIFTSQVPAFLGYPMVPGTPVFTAAFDAITCPNQCSLGAVIVSFITVLCIFGFKRISKAFPGVLVAAVLGLGAGHFGLAVGPLLGSVPSGLPVLQLALPWERVLEVLLPATIIALVGFTEAAAISSRFAEADGEEWSGGRELVSQGSANIAVAFFGGHPVGGSFSRSSLCRLVGGRTRWTGAFSALVVLAILPFASALEALPKVAAHTALVDNPSMCNRQDLPNACCAVLQAVLGATVISAVVPLLLAPGPLMTLRALVRMRRKDSEDASFKGTRGEVIVAWSTTISVLLAAPRLEQGLLVGGMVCCLRCL